jgi:hypothetical protein
MLSAALAIIGLALAGCAGVPGAAQSDWLQGRIMYTAYNLWVEQPDEVSDINYKRGFIVPAGSAVSAVGIQDSSRAKRIRFTLAADGRSFVIHWNQRYHPGKSPLDFAAELFSEKDFAQQSARMTTEEIGAIKSGLVVPGMRKQAVLVSYGPPPEHMTPNQEASVWTYWTARFVTQAVRFDSQNRVIDIGPGGK